MVFSKNFRWSAVDENSASHDLDIERNIADRLRKEADDALTFVENWVHDGILTTMDNVVIPRVEMAVRSITGPSVHRPNNVVQNLTCFKNSWRQLAEQT